MIFWERLLNKQFRAWQLMRQLRRTSLSAKLHPCITVSRETGSGGREIAQKVAKTLEMNYYDKELVDLVAKTAKKRRQLIKALDERTQDGIATIVNSFLGFESLPEGAYIKSLIRLVLGIAACHSAVIVGRGANFILPKKTILRVRVIAPLAVRINYTRAHHQNESDEELIEKMKRVHQDRKGFVKKYFNKNISNANYYDLVVNTEDCSISQASEIIVATYRSRFRV